MKRSNNISIISFRNSYVFGEQKINDLKLFSLLNILTIYTNPYKISSPFIIINNFQFFLSDDCSIKNVQSEDLLVKTV